MEYAYYGNSQFGFPHQSERHARRKGHIEIEVLTCRKQFPESRCSLSLPDWLNSSPEPTSTNSTDAGPAGAVAQTTNTGDAKFSASAHLVIEDVTVKDKNGKVIEGLKAEDFTVTEDGKPQTISFCTSRICPTRRLTLPPRRCCAGDTEVAAVTSTQISPEAPGDLRYKDRRLLSIYFDMSAMPQADQLRALDAAQKFVKSQMAAPDLMAIMEYTGGAVKVLQDFTDDREKLLTVIGTLIAGEGQGFDEDPADASSAATPAQPSARTIANSTSSIQTANSPPSKPRSAT